MWTFPLWHYNNTILSCLKIVCIVYCFRIRVFSCDPTILSVELFLENYHPIPNVIVIKTAILVKTSLFLPHRYSHHSGLTHFKYSKRNIKSRWIIASTFNVDTDWTHSFVLPFARTNYMNSIKVLKHILKSNKYCQIIRLKGMFGHYYTFWFAD